MDTRYRSYLLGLNKDRTKMNEYINSDNFREHRELQLQSGLLKRRITLCVVHRLGCKIAGAAGLL